ncbi:Microtubule-associated serine/threonine-protein kinase-like protein [Echinococcus granulosus]|uniref:Serine/threonine-protein kinase greatwall n=1 Tax=Echinococcus granulosus TaxID=6210 RepID=W6UF58_ECHGR|nr:Microtubule-associated serine/threonine-protein kinase-like protein [Echinococcus granulosus]EUB59748.1 Microtubule-associated serine/threonine-protein kinase-like protein [Echinococcus granulosus]
MLLYPSQSKRTLVIPSIASAGLTAATDALEVVCSPTGIPQNWRRGTQCKVNFDKPDTVADPGSIFDPRREKVFLGAKKKNNRQLYAIKAMSKSAMRKKNLVSQVTAERNALAVSKCPYIVHLYYSLQTKDYVYLIMEYLIGGDLKSLIMAAGYLDERPASLYMAEMVIAVKYLHEHGIIHRDLKPDNVLITAKGHLKLTDFGLSSVSWSKVLSPADVLYTPSATRMSQAFSRTPGQIISLTTDLSFKNSRVTESSGASFNSHLITDAALNPVTSRCSSPNANESPHSRSWSFSPSVDNTVASRTRFLSDDSKPLKHQMPPRTPASQISSIGGRDDHYDAQLDSRLPRSSSPVHCHYVALPRLRRALSAVKLHYPSNNSLASSSSTHSLGAAPDNHSEVTEEGNKENVPTTTLGFVFKTPSRPPRRAARTQAPATISFDDIGQRKHITSADFNNAVCLSQLNPSRPPDFGRESTPLEAQVTPLRTPRSLRPPSNLVTSQATGRGRGIKLDPQICKTASQLFDSSSSESVEASARSFDHQPPPPPLSLRLTGIPYDPHNSASFRYEPRKPPSSSAVPHLRPGHVFGTPEYLAPELLTYPQCQQAADNPAVDWWALGVILFEMLTGVSPFADDSLEEIFEHIIKLDIPWPVGEEARLSEGGGISPTAEDLIRGLLEREPPQRLETAKNIEQHAFFTQVGPWSNLQNVTMPFVPCPDDDADTCYFERDPWHGLKARSLSGGTMVEHPSGLLPKPELKQPTYCTQRLFSFERRPQRSLWSTSRVCHHDVPCAVRKHSRSNPDLNATSLILLGDSFVYFCSLGLESSEDEFNRLKYGSETAF